MSLLTLGALGLARLKKPIDDNFNAIQAWANGNVGFENLSANAVYRDALQDDSVSHAKMASLSVGVDELIDFSATPQKLAKTGFVYGVLHKTATTMSGTAETWYNVSNFSLGTITPEFDCYLLTNYTVTFNRGAVALASPLYTEAMARIATSAGASLLISPNSMVVPFAAWSATAGSINGLIPLTKGTEYSLVIQAKESANTPLLVTCSGYSLILPR